MGKEAEFSSRKAFLCNFSVEFIIFHMQYRTTCSEHQQFAWAVFIFRLFLQNPPVQPQMQKHPFKQIPFHRYIIESQQVLKSSFHPSEPVLEEALPAEPTLHFV